MIAIFATIQRPLQVKQAYRQLCKAHHPDLHVTCEEVRRAQEETFKEITEAYRRLTSSMFDGCVHTTDVVVLCVQAANTKHTLSHTHTKPTSGPHNFTAAATHTSARTAPRDSYGRTRLNEHQRHSPFSNVVVASILAVPLAMLGVWLGRSWDRQLQSIGRPYGLWHPPVNPYLRDDHVEQAKRRAAREAAKAAAAANAG